MIFCHVAVTPTEDYATRRAAYREHHLARALELRSRGLMVAGGPAPAGQIFHLARGSRETSLFASASSNRSFTGSQRSCFRSR